MAISAGGCGGAARAPEAGSKAARAGRECRRRAAAGCMGTACRDGMRGTDAADGRRLCLGALPDAGPAHGTASIGISAPSAACRERLAERRESRPAGRAQGRVPAGRRARQAGWAAGPAFGICFRAPRRWRRRRDAGPGRATPVRRARLRARAFRSARSSRQFRQRSRQLQSCASSGPQRLSLDGPEADRGGKVESRGGQHRGHQPCALHVEVGHQQAGHQPAHHALHRHHVQPAPVPGQQPEDGGQKDQRQQRCRSSAATPSRRSASASRSSPGRPATAAAGRRSGPATAAAGRSGRRRTGRSSCARRGAAPDRWPCSARDRRRDRWPAREKGGARPAPAQAPETCSGAAARRRQNNRNGLHDGDAPLRRPPRIDANEPPGRTRNPRAALYYPRRRSGIPGKTRQGEPCCPTPAGELPFRQPVSRCTCCPRSAARRRAGCGRWRTG